MSKRRNTSNVVLYPDLVVGVRNMSRSYKYIPSLQVNPDGRMKKQQLGPRGSRTDNSIMPFGEWQNMRRADDESIREGSLVRDDSVVPSGYDLGPSDDLANPNVVIAEMEIVRLPLAEFEKRVKLITSDMVLERVEAACLDLQENGEVSGAQRVSIAMEQRLVLAALAAGMPQELASATKEELVAFCRGMNPPIPIGREEGRYRKNAMMTVCNWFIEGGPLTQQE